MSKWETIGYCGVDAGLIMLVDPCYIVPDEQWSDFYDEYESGEFAHVANMRGGVVVTTAFGDGQYPVEARYNNQGQIVEVRISLE